MSLVLDSSATLAWIYEDETTDAIREVFDIVIADDAWVPALWRIEVANALEMGVRRKRTSAAFRDKIVANLILFPIRLDEETDHHAWGSTLRLAVRHRLTLYDASYLELALRRGLPLATLDMELRAAAAAEKVALLGM
jgi:predicted nucleic acid-binding protein